MSSSLICRLTAAALLSGIFIFSSHLDRGGTASSASTLPPAIENAIRGDLAALISVDEADIDLVRVEPVTWRNGCLGVYRPEASCLLAVVDGYVVWSTANGAGYRYHTDREATVLLAEEAVALTSIASAELPESVIATPQTRGILLAGTVPASGFGMVVFGGGDYGDLVAATGCAPDDARFWAAVDGRLLTLIPAASPEVNAAFDAAFAGAIASGTVVIASCPATEIPSSGPPRLAAVAAGRSGPLGLGAYCWPFQPVEQQLCIDGGLTTTAQVFDLRSGDPITVGGLPRGVESIEATVFSRPEDTGLQEGANRVSWVAAGPTTELPASMVGSRLSLQQTLPSGNYLLSLNIRWASNGVVFDASYGLQFDVH